MSQDAGPPDDPVFRRALAIVFACESGYVYHPLDRGGATNYGITQSTYAVWRQSVGLPLQPVKFISRDEAQAIYERDYWRKGCCDALPVPVALVHFDAAVNHGVHAAAILLQAVAGVVQDGVIGPATLEAVREADPTRFARRYIERRRRFYRDIVAETPSQAIFYKGWLARMDALDKEVAIA